MLGKKQEQFARMLAEFITWLYSKGYTVRIGEVWRPQEMQELYFKQGKTKTLKSKHTDKTAADLAIFKDGKWLQTKDELLECGQKWCSINPDNQWGGNWKFLDSDHFQYGV